MCKLSESLKTLTINRRPKTKDCDSIAVILIPIHMYATFNFSMGFNIVAIYMDCVTHK